MKPSSPKLGLRVGRTRRLTLYFIGLALWSSGALWLLFHYFLQRNGAFGPQPHPLEPWWLRIHGALAIVTVWLFGLFWGIHVTLAWPVRKRRASGTLTIAALLLLTVTGYLLYYVGDDVWRVYISALHWIFGLASPAALVWHRVKRKHRRAVPGEISRQTA